MRIIQLVFELEKLVAKIKGVLSVCAVAVVTYYAITITIIGLQMAGHLSGTNIVVSVDKHRRYTSVKE